MQPLNHANGSACHGSWVDVRRFWRTVKNLIVMADYMCGIFLSEGGLGPEEFGASPDFCARFNSWLRRYREHDDAPADFDRQSYNETGRALACEIQRLLAGRYSVTYRCLVLADSSSADCEWAEEQLA